MLVNRPGVVRMPANGFVASVPGSMVTALVMEPLSTILRCASSVKDDFLVSGPAGAAFEFIQQEGSLGGRVWIARVPKVVGEIPLRRSAILVGARLGEDFDLAVAQLVILRRERVLVDANLADGF